MSITILKKEPGKDLELIEIDGSLSSMQKIVKGYLGRSSLGYNIDLWYNDESLLVPDCKKNLFLGSQIIYGDVFFAAHDHQGNTTSLSVSQMMFIKEHLKKFNSLSIPIYFNESNEGLETIEKLLKDCGERQNG